MYGRYALTLTGTILLCATCIVAIALLVDPYRLFPDVSRYGPDKPADLFYYLRLHKPYAIRRVKPDHLIVGSSRSARLAPAELEAGGGVAYNAALPGASLEEVQRVIEHAHAQGGLRTVLFGVDYLMFANAPVLDPNVFVDARWRRQDAGISDRLGHAYQGVLDTWRSLFSVDVLVDIWYMLTADEANKRSQRTYSDDGTWELTSTTRTEAQRVAFMARQVYGDLHENPDKYSLEGLASLLAFAAENDIEVMLFVSPRQAVHLQTLYLAGHWSRYQQWHRDIVAMADASDGKVTVFGIEDNPTLVLPALQPEGEPLFRDGIHYRRGAGEDMVACMLGPCDSPLRPTRLESANVDNYLNALDALRTRFLEESPDSARKLRKWLGLNKGGK